MLIDRIKVVEREREVLFWKDILVDHGSSRPVPRGSPFLPVLVTMGPYIPQEKDNLVPTTIAAEIENLARHIREMARSHCWTLSPGSRNSLLVLFRHGFFRDFTHRTAFFNSWLASDRNRLSIVVGPEFSAPPQVRFILEELLRQVSRLPILPQADTAVSPATPELSGFTKLFPAACRRSSAQELQRVIEAQLGLVIAAGSSQSDLVQWIRSIHKMMREERGGLQSLPFAMLHDQLLQLLLAPGNRKHLAADLGHFLAQYLSDKPLSHQKADLVDKIDAYLSGHLADPVSLGELGSLFDRDPNYLSSLYREIKGLSPIQRMTQIRMERAATLLVEKPELLIRDIAEIVGYDDQAYFTKVFKKCNGCDPSEFRRVAGKDNLK